MEGNESDGNRGEGGEGRKRGEGEAIISPNHNFDGERGGGRGVGGGVEWPEIGIS